MDDFLDILTMKGAVRRPVDTKSTFIWLFWGSQNINLDLALLINPKLIPQNFDFLLPTRVA